MIFQKVGLSTVWALGFCDRKRGGLHASYFVKSPNLDSRIVTSFKSAN
jgi:hypothetical protein